MRATYALESNIVGIKNILDAPFAPQNKDFFIFSKFKLVPCTYARTACTLPHCAQWYDVYVFGA